ncbi:Eco57I restriction-modification methylase domain-containing protein [Corynebacterium vitaeruminis]|uniref:Eco57I restriction-modification methylase domain-containing protein n=1 Tax=Corynebacterium vitaeruminis TaxID=38305 RepID=UPI0023F0D4ED|nr:DNA methyltransferase [Corynebacterium vitaeruminis]
MAAFDSIVNVEEWISDYYLTTDEKKGESFGKRVDERIKDWKNQDKETGEQTSPWGRLTKERNELQKLLAVLDPENPDTLTSAYEKIEAIFGYGAPTLLTKERSDKELVFSGTTDKPGSFVLVRAGQIQGPEDITEQTPITQVLLNEKPQDWSIATFVGELFLTELPPQFVVVLAGTWVLLAERETWPLGRFLAIDLGVAIERNDAKARGELSRVAAALAREDVERGADGTTWWLDTLSQAHNHSVSVSGELRNAIRRSIEIIGNDVMDRRKEQGLPVEGIDGNELAKQSLRYLYRILFLLFAEASPELEILPTGDNDYDEGYGLARLRDLILNEPTTERAQRGTHLYQSLQLLFRYVDQGHDPNDEDFSLYDANAGEDGLTFRNLSADLFKQEATAYIDQVQLSNVALYQVLQNLLLTKEKRGSDRGFISYATLGVTELGQVYEGLMSYTGFIAAEDLVEVAPHGDPSKGSWVVAEKKIVDNPDYLPVDCYVLDQVAAKVGGYKDERRCHRAGSFVFRQSSRDRERSASFYSPPVITKFTVGQAIEELEAAGRIAEADDILTLSICEPAMGSGAFAVEAVNQLAELYLKKKQEELGKEIPGDERTMELQKVKATIALHQVHGVDLNATAVELAEISLWLDTMTSDLKAPWFGLHLRHGNSLIGARRATFAANELRKKDYLKATPKRQGVKGIAAAIAQQEHDPAALGRVHHFLVPSNGWGAAADAKDLKDIAPDEIKAMKVWRSEMRKGFTATQVKQLQSLAGQVERFWELALVRLQIAEEQIRRDISVWGQEFNPTAKNVTREKIEEKLFHDKHGAYQRLRLVMDAWNALWFWPITKTNELPSIDEWIATLTDILGVRPKIKENRSGTHAFGYDMRWEDLDVIESLDIVTANCVKFDELLKAHPWLNTAIEVAQEQAFFHWDLDFAVVMSKGGFDFQVGNPPWVRPDVDFDALLSEHDPWFTLAHKPTQAEKRARRALLADDPNARDTLTRGIAESVVTAAVLGDVTLYPHLKDQRPDLYRGFIERTWAHASEAGIISLIHPESHFTEKKAASLRAAAYLRLRRHWQFINELMLFDVDHHVSYGIHVYGAGRIAPRFLSAASLYHPQTVVDSFAHNGDGGLPGFKDDNGHWDLRPHRDRIITVNEDTLRVWNSILEDEGTPLLHTRTVYSVNSEAAAVLAKLAEAPRVKQLGLQFSGGWNETTDKKRGYFDSSFQESKSWSDVILQGPHLGVSTPMIKQPNRTMKHNQDWSDVDLEAMGEDFIPAAAYKPNKEIKTYASDYGSWVVNGKRVHVIDQYRVAWREMAATTGYRTVYPSLIPPGAAHVHTVNSAWHPTELSAVGALMSSILSDFMIRSAGTGHVFRALVEALPFVPEAKQRGRAERLYLRLNCLTSAYAPLWESVTGTPWTMDVPLRNARDRWHAQNEIDAIVALSLGVTLEELLMIYRTQFPVMRRYDREDLYDANGRKVQGEVLKAQKKAGLNVELPESQRRWTHPQSGVEYLFEYPFAPLDREADLATCYEKYASMMEN